MRAASLAWRAAVPLALIVLILLAFMPALGAGFVHWDDDDLLIAETRYRGFSADSIAWMFTTSYAGHFQPLTWLSYAVDYDVWGLHAFGFHLTNVFLHVLTTLAFYFVARQLLGLATGKASSTRSKPFVLSAGLAAALFAVHPLRAESVAWIAERRDVLSGFLFVASVGCYLQYAWRGMIGPVRPNGHEATFGRWSFYTASVALCLFSLLAKASAITLPFVLLILDVYPLRRVRGRNAPGEATGGVWIEKLPFLAPAAWVGARALSAQAEGGALYAWAEHDWIARIAQACYGLVFYIWKTVWPTGLGPLYNIPPREVLLGPMLWGSLAALVVVVLTAVWMRRRRPAIPTVLAAYVVILVPVLGLAQSGPQLVADRYSYLACMGFAVLAAGWLLQALQGRSWWAVAPRRSLLGLVIAVALVALERATYQQTDIWQSPRHLWRRGVQISPDSAVAHVNYADALAAGAVTAEMLAPAAWHYKEALKLDPDDPVALHHYADVLRQLGRAEQAIEYYLRSLRIDPTRRRACYSLAHLFVAAGRPQLAVTVLRDGARRNPAALELMEYLARLLASHPDENVRNGQEALKWATKVNGAYGQDNIAALTTLATALANVGRFGEAVETAERALTLAEKQEADHHITKLRHRLPLFREGKPYHLGP